MAEATQQFVPVQSNVAAPSVGVAPDMPQDTMFNTVYKYAQKNNVANLQTARQEDYLDGQLQAAQLQSVDQVRKDQPWIYSVFGGGASLSGAMDYMHKTKLMEYQKSVNDGMDESRMLSPEAFKKQQMDSIKQFYTDDDETNKRILQSFEFALPSLVSAHAAEHESFVQEQNLKSMTQAVDAALKNMELLRGTGTAAENMAQEQLGLIIKRPDGMNTGAYKQFLLDMAKPAAMTGDTSIHDYLMDSGIVSSPDDLAVLIKADKEYAGYMAEKMTIANGDAQHQMKVESMDDTITDGDYTRNVHRNAEKFKWSPETIKSILNYRLDKIKDGLAAHRLGENVSLMKSGQLFKVPSGKRQEVMNVEYEALHNSKVQPAQFWKEMHAGGVPSKMIKNTWSSGLSMTMTTDTEGNPVASAGALEVIAEIDDAREALGYKSKTVLDHLTPEANVMYKAYKAQQTIDPTGGTTKWMSEAVEAVESHKAGSGSYVGTVTADERDMIIDNMDTFDADAFEDNPMLKNEMDDILSTLNANSPAGIKAAHAEALLHKRVELCDGVYVYKVNGKGLSERTGLKDPVKAAREYMNLHTLIDGKSVVGRNMYIRPDSVFNRFSVFDETGQVRDYIDFEDIKNWEQHAVKESTPQSKQALAVTTAQSRYHLAAGIVDDLESGISREELWHEYHPKTPYVPDERAARTDRQFAQLVIQDMDDEQLVSEYRNFANANGQDTSIWGQLVDTFFEVREGVKTKASEVYNEVVQNYAEVKQQEEEYALSLAEDEVAAQKATTDTKYGLREDGTPKDVGFLGELKRTDGGVSTELSATSTVDGEELFYPLLVPGLSDEQKSWLLKGNDPTPEINDIAVRHALKRKAEGKSPFFKSGEEDKVTDAKELIPPTVPATKTSPAKWMGADAIAKVEEREGELTEEQKIVVEYEGFVDGSYPDKYANGLETSGVGQTGKFKNMTFKEAFKVKEDYVKQAIPTYDTLPHKLRGELVASAYRGDLVKTHKWVKALNAGDYNMAAIHLLNDDDFRKYGRMDADGDKSTNTNIPERFLALYDELLKMDNI